MKHAADRQRLTVRIAILLALAASLSCRHVTTVPDYRDRLSAVWRVTAPDSVAVGDSLVIEIGTQGNNGCWQRGHDEVSWTAPLVVKITPYDREYVGTGVCTQNLPTFQHRVPLIAPTRGTIEVSVFHRLRAASGAESTGVMKLSVSAR